MRINKPAALKMNLNVGDKIALVYDEEHPDNWYLIKDTDGFVLHQYGGSLLCHAKGMMMGFLEKLGLEQGTYQIPTGEVTDGMLTLITKGAKKIG